MRNSTNIIYIHQPNFLPWIGMVQRIYNSSKYVILDDVQFSQYGYQNRTFIKSPNGKQIITVPVKHEFKKEIREIKISKNFNKKKVLGSIFCNYKKSPFFDIYFPQFEIAFNKRLVYLLDLNVDLINIFINILNINTEIVKSSELNISSKEKNERIKEILLLEQSQNFKDNILYAGMGCKNYLDINSINDIGFKVYFDEFNFNCPTYNQNFKKIGFIPNLCALDIIFNLGGNKTREIFRSYGQNNIFSNNGKK